MSRFRFRRDSTQVAGPDSPSLSYSPQSGAWTPAPITGGSCANSAESTITPGSSVTFRFTGTDVSVNILKNTNGAPYNVTIDGSGTPFNAYSTSEQCTADFRATGLTNTEHTVVVTHDGSSSLAASGRSTLEIISFQYTGTALTPSSSSNSSKSSTPVGAIVGGIIGALAVIILVAAIVWYCRRRRRRVVEQDRSFSPRKDEVIREPYNSPFSPYVVPGSNNGPSSSSDPLAGATLIPQRRTKATEAAANNNARYVHSSPWTSLTSQNRSQQNMANDPNNNVAYSGYTSSVIQSGIHSYPPGSATEVTDDPEDSNSASPRIGAFSPNQSRPSHQAPASVPHPSSRHHAPVPVPVPPSTVGESVLIDDPDYIPPPSYSPGPSNLPRHTSLMQRAKAAYEGTSSGSSRAFSPSSSQRPLPQSPPQPLSQEEVDVIARRVVDLLRSGSSAAGSSVIGSGIGSGTGSEISMSSNEVANPQVQQAIRVLLNKEDSQPASGGIPEKS